MRQVAQLMVNQVVAVRGPRFVVQNLHASCRAIVIVFITIFFLLFDCIQSDRKTSHYQIRFIRPIQVSVKHYNTIRLY